MIITLQIVEGNESGKNGHLKIFTVEALNKSAERAIVFRAWFLHHITDTDNMYGYAPQI